MHFVAFDRTNEQGVHICLVDPAYPLAPMANGSSKAQSSELRQTGQGTTAATQYKARSQNHLARVR